MSPQKRMPSARWLAMTLRSRSSWTSSRRKKVERLLAREQHRMQLFLAMQDSQLLLLKRLEQELFQLEQAERELAESRAYRMEPIPLPPPVTPEELDQQLLA